MVWRLSSNQRPLSLSTATRPWGYLCHTAYTPVNTLTHTYIRHKEKRWGEGEEVTVSHLEHTIPLDKAEHGAGERRRRMSISEGVGGVLVRTAILIYVLTEWPQLFSVTVLGNWAWVWWDSSTDREADNCSTYAHIREKSVSQIEATPFHVKQCKKKQQIKQFHSLFLCIYE